MQAAYDVGLVAMRSTTDSSRRSRERRCEEAITALSTALDAAGLAGSSSSSSTSSLSTAANDNLAATPATVAALSDAYRALVDFTTAFVSVDPAVAGTAPAASARAVGGGAIDTPTFTASSSRESFAAIESVFPRSAVASLRGLTRDELAAHASGVARLSLGARLFNWSEGRGGLGLEHVPSAAVSEAATLTSDVNAVLRSASASAAAYIDVWAAVAKGVAGPVMTALSATAGTPPDESEWPSELANRRMLAVLTAALADDVRAREAEAANALSEWSVALGTLQRSVRGISTVSKDSVFPFFADLADAWIRAAGVRSAVAGVAGLLRAILPYSAPQVCTLPETVAAQAASALGPTARAAAAETLPIVQFAASGAAPGETAYSISLDSPEAASALETPIALQGFCPVALATPPPRLLLSTNGKGSEQSVYGALLPGDPNHGVLVYRGTQYIVSSKSAATAFLASPSAYVNAALTATRAAPELVHLLQLLSPAPFGFAEASLPALAACDGDVAVAAAAHAIRSAITFSSNTSTPNPLTSNSTSTATIQRTNRLGVTVADASVATPVHFIERHIDPRYSFSEWVLRRQALALANVRKCVTHSAQTDGSHFRRDNDAQVYLPRESGTQTRIDTGTTTDREPIQLVRVRGAREPVVEAAASRVAAGLPALP
jgi:hypothetical protein